MKGENISPRKVKNRVRSRITIFYVDVEIFGTQVPKNQALDFCNTFVRTQDLIKCREKHVPFIKENYHWES